MTIPKKRLPHRVSLVEVTYSRGVRTEGTAQTDVYARVFDKRTLTRDADGDRYVVRTMVAFLPGETITPQTEVIVNGVQRPITEIRLIKDSRNINHHYEVTLG